MNNFINFFNAFASYLVLLLISVVLVVVAVKIGIVMRKKKDAKEAMLAGTTATSIE